MVQPRGDRGRKDGPRIDSRPEGNGRLRDRRIPAQQGHPVAAPVPLARALEAALRTRRGEEVAADPLLFPRRYRARGDVEAAAFVAASFAFGNVPQILSFLERLFAAIGPSPHAALSGDRPLPPRRLAGLRYRFISSAGVHRFLFCTWHAYREQGSLENLYRRGLGSAPRER